MGNLFEQINILSRDINARIEESGVAFEDDYVGDRNREIIKIELGENEKSVLVLGINPSITKAKGEEAYPNINFLKATKNSKRLPKVYKRYTHTYHEQRYNYLFEGLSMMWEKDSYLNPYIEEYSEIEDEKLKIEDKEAFLKGLEAYRVHSKNYVIFADCLHFKVTQSDKIQPFLKDKKALDRLIKKQGGESKLSEEAFKELQNDIFHLFELQLEYYRPELVWINFKNLTNFLKPYLKNKGVTIETIYQKPSKNNGEVKFIDSIFKAEYKGINIYFTNFFTAGGMTTDEKEFLKQEIDRELVRLGMR